METANKWKKIQEGYSFSSDNGKLDLIRDTYLSYWYKGKSERTCYFSTGEITTWVTRKVGKADVNFQDEKVSNLGKLLRKGLKAKGLPKREKGLVLKMKKALEEKDFI